MALVNVVNMTVLDNPTSFLNPFQFEITFECLQALEDDLEWKVLYVGSATDASKDQILDEILVGPVPVGVNKFCLQADGPDPHSLDEILGVTVVLVTCSYRNQEFIRIGYYVNNEYMHPDYVQAMQDAEERHVAALAAHATSQQQQQQQRELAASLPEGTGTTNITTTTAVLPVVGALPLPIPHYPSPPPPSLLDISYVQRQILADKPRVTKFPIGWDDNNHMSPLVAAAGATAAAATPNGGSAASMISNHSLMDMPSTAAPSEMEVE